MAFDQERYTIAMMALGYARGVISRMRAAGAEYPKALDVDIAYLDKLLERVMYLNDAPEPAATEDGDARPATRRT